MTSTNKTFVVLRFSVSLAISIALCASNFASTKDLADGVKPDEEFNKSSTNTVELEKNTDSKSTPEASTAAETLNAEGVKFFKNHDYINAEKSYIKALEQGHLIPNNSKQEGYIYSNLSVLFEAKGDNQRAAEMEKLATDKSGLRTAATTSSIEFQSSPKYAWLSTNFAKQFTFPHL